MALRTEVTTKTAALDLRIPPHQALEIPPMPPVPASDADGRKAKADRQLAHHLRQAGYRRRWWFPVVLLLLPFVLVWSLLKVDQWVADTMVWPLRGTQFVELTNTVTDLRPDTRRLTVVIGGLNRKSGTSIADALAPSLRQPDTQVVSLVYGSGIVESDVLGKFDQLVRRLHPDVVDFYGSSMGGDIALLLANHLADKPFRPDDPSGYYPPRIGVIFLDCSPLGPADVREASRTQADALTAVTEATGTNGGVGARVTVEVLAQHQQWADRLLPLRGFRWGDFSFKVDEVFRDKVFHPGISTGLVKDQYGVIRRLDADEIFRNLPQGTQIVYLRPFNPDADTTVDVATVQDQLWAAAFANDLRLSVRMIIDGHHASAERNAEAYNNAISGEYAEIAARSGQRR